MRNSLLSILLVCFSAMVGCNSAAPGMNRVLGPVDYDKAFNTAKDVLSQHFSLAESDREAGVIVSRPRLVESRHYRLTTSQASRQIATLRLRPDGKYVTAYLSIELQRQGAEAHRYFDVGRESYSGAPNRTPSEIEAATTAEQNQVWITVSYDKKLERTILNQLSKAIRESIKLPPPE